MNKHLIPELDFEAAQGAALDGEALIVNLEGFEGPLDVLLALARSQKVDLLKLSVTRLAEQYLVFVREARRRSFALAADYLVMAAWLAFLKSRLLLPSAAPTRPEEPSAEQAALRLTLRLAKLDAMRQAAEALSGLSILRRDVFPRGTLDEARTIRRRRLEGDLLQLMEAYAGQRRRATQRAWRPAPANAYRLEEARSCLRGLLSSLDAWTLLDCVTPTQREGGPARASLLASTLSASLEFVREGALEARQLGHFSEIWLRAQGARS